MSDFHPEYDGSPVVWWGHPGASAYELAVKNGFSGSLEEWFDSLRGEAGPPPALVSGTTVTGEPGSEARVWLERKGDVYTLNARIPRGESSDQSLNPSSTIVNDPN